MYNIQMYVCTWYLHLVLDFYLLTFLVTSKFNLFHKRSPGRCRMYSSPYNQKTKTGCTGLMLPEMIKNQLQNVAKMIIAR